MVDHPQNAARFQRGVEGLEHARRNGGIILHQQIVDIAEGQHDVRAAGGKGGHSGLEVDRGNLGRAECGGLSGQSGPGPLGLRRGHECDIAPTPLHQRREDFGIPPPARQELDHGLRRLHTEKRQRLRRVTGAVPLPVRRRARR